MMLFFYETRPHFPTLSRIGYMFKLDIVESSDLGAIDAYQSPAVLFQRRGKQFLKGHTSYRRVPFYHAPLFVVRLWVMFADVVTFGSYLRFPALSWPI